MAILLMDRTKTQRITNNASGLSIAKNNKNKKLKKVKTQSKSSLASAKNTKVKYDKSEAQTLFVKVSFLNAKDTHAELIKKFSNTSKDIRTSRCPNHFFVEFENPETMEANKEVLESLEVNGEQVFVDYVGKRGKRPLSKYSDAHTLLVKVSYSNCKDTHAELIKKFSNTSKDIRTSRWPNQFYVEFENPETMEANKESLESLEVV